MCNYFVALTIQFDCASDEVRWVILFVLLREVEMRITTVCFYSLHREKGEGRCGCEGFEII